MSCGLRSGKIESSIISNSLSAATNLVRSTLSAHDPPGFPLVSRLYMFITSGGISLSPMAAILSLPLVLAVSTLLCRTFLFEPSSFCWLNGSPDNPKSKVVSVGIRGLCSGISCAEETWRDAATRFAAFALAICSLKAADDFLLEATEGDSAESIVSAVFVDVLEAPEGFVSEVAEDLWEAEDAFLGVCAGALLSSAVMDGFLNSPVMDCLGFTGRAASVFEPYFDAGVPFARLSGLGVLDRGTSGGFGGVALAAKARKVPFWIDFVNGGLRDRIFRPRDGVPSMVDKGFLYVLVEARKLGVLSSGPELELGLLFGREDGLNENEPSERWLDPGR